MRDNQRRITEIPGPVKSGHACNRLLNAMYSRLDGLSLPEGDFFYDGGSRENRKQGRGIDLLLNSPAIIYWRRARTLSLK